MHPAPYDNWSSVPGWRAARLGVWCGRVRCGTTGQLLKMTMGQSTPTVTRPTQESFCTVEWISEDQDDGESDPLLPQLAVAEAMDLGSATW